MNQIVPKLRVVGSIPIARSKPPTKALAPNGMDAWVKAGHDDSM